MKQMKNFEELKRLPKYRNMSFGAENEFYNDLMRKMEKNIAVGMVRHITCIIVMLQNCAMIYSQAKLHLLNGRRNLLTQTYALICGWDQMTRYRLLKRK